MTRLTQRIAAAWDAFWFTPAPALNLAAARVVFALHAIWILGSRDLAACPIRCSAESSALVGGF